MPLWPWGWRSADATARTASSCAASGQAGSEEQKQKGCYEDGTTNSMRYMERVESILGQLLWLWRVFGLSRVFVQVFKNIF